MAKRKVLPCPCGDGIPLSLRRCNYDDLWPDGTSTTSYTITCESCESDSAIGETIEKAIKSWNKMVRDMAKCKF